jgi:hypothetical protein
MQPCSFKCVCRYAFDDEAARRRLWNEGHRKKIGSNHPKNPVSFQSSSPSSPAEAAAASAAAASPPFATAVNLHFISKFSDQSGLTLTFQSVDTDLAAAVDVSSPSSFASFELGDFVTLSTMKVLAHP